MQFGAAGDFDAGIDGDGATGLVGLLPIDQHFAGEDEGLCFLARFGEAAIDQ